MSEKENIHFQVDEMKTDAMLAAQKKSWSHLPAFFSSIKIQVPCYVDDLFCLCPKCTSLISILANRGVYSMRPHFRIIETMPLSLCAIAEFSQEVVGTVLVFNPKGKLWHLTLRVNLAYS